MNPHPFAAWRFPGPATSRRAAAGVLASLVLTAACIALAPASASAAPPAQFVGIQSWQNLSEAEFDRMGKNGVKVVRVQLSWNSVEPERPTNCDAARTRCTRHDYRWGRYDQLFSDAARNGVRLVPVLLGSPKWATPDNRWPPARPYDSVYKYPVWRRQAFYDFARTAARRYGPNGTFWSGKGYDGSVRARFWQIWNEPNLPNYMWNDKNGSRAAKAYARLLRVTRDALKRGDSGVQTLAAGLPWSSGASLDPPSFLKVMFAQDGTAARTNFVAIHPYGKTPSLVLEGVRLTRSAVNSTAAKSRPIWITEFGWAQSGPSSTFTVNPDTQAKYLRDTYRAFLKYRTTYGIKGAIWFNLINVKPPAGEKDYWYYHTGLFKSDRKTPYESWSALKCVTTGTSCWAGR